ncbi:MAG TPA: hypothetical protein VNA32_05665 [Actinomycetota bacterium]|nr:hypothetical protein [Actinomycetota bacterium]
MKILRRVVEFVVMRVWPYPLGWYFRGCCGCGNRFADVVSEPSEGAPRGEGYCWDCVEDGPPIVYRVLRSGWPRYHTELLGGDWRE